MRLALNARRWWECSGDKLWAMNLKRPNFIAQDDECHRRGGNQALMLAEPSEVKSFAFYVTSTNASAFIIFEKIQGII